MERRGEDFEQEAIVDDTHYDYWAAKLRGEDPDPLEPRSDMPCGFWRLRDNRPLAVWIATDGTRHALAGFEGHARFMRPLEMSRVAEMGGFGLAVPEQDYREAFTLGFWHDDPPPVTAPGPGHNISGDPFEVLRDELQDEADMARAFLAAPIEDQATADKAATWARRIGQLATRLDQAHDAEKAPHLEAGKAVDDKWRAMRGTARDLVEKLKRHLEPFLKRQKREAEARAREASERAQRLREEAERATRPESIERAEMVEEAQALEKEAARPVRVIAGRPNMRVGLRRERTAKVVDFDACMMALKDHPDMKALVQSLANRAVKAGLTLPGVEVEEIEGT